MTIPTCHHPAMTVTETEETVCDVCDKALTPGEVAESMMKFGTSVSTVFVNQVESITLSEDVDMVNHPPHYRSSATCSKCGHPIQAIDVIRHIKDGRIYTAMKYLWRVGLGGGKADDVEDVGKAKWYLTDYENHPVS